MVIAGRYRILERLGAGGMATVLLAVDERLGRQVALKRLHPEVGDAVAQRFDREARLGASLSHPNVVSVYDVLADEDQVVLVMEYVEGRTLAEVLSEESLSPDSVIELLRPLASALDHAHGEGVVHRDVKPANLLVRSDGAVKLADLGIATAADLTSVTATGTALGTVTYMAPEQIEGRRVTAAADVYALAAVAFEMLSGRKARTGATPMEIVHRIATEGPPDLAEAWPGASPAAAEVLRRAMSAKPEERPSSAGELVDQLEEALELAPAAAAAGSATEPAEAQPPTAVEPQPTPTAEPQPTPTAAEPTRTPTAAEPTRTPTAAEPTRDTPAPAPTAETGALPRRPADTARRGVAGPDRPVRAEAQRAAPRPSQTPRRRRGRAVAAVALVLGLAGAGAIVALGLSKDEPTPPANAPREEAERPKDPRPASSPAPPEEVARAFYRRAAAGRYRAAWSLAGPGLRAQLGGFDSFRAQFETLESITFDRAQKTRQTSDSSTVAIATTAVHTDRTDTCRGTVSLAREARARRWLIDRIGVDC